MAKVDRLAPVGPDVFEYDRKNLALYAALLDAADAGEDWRVTVVDLMKLDATDVDAEACWRSHVERARWVIGDGLEAALIAFGTRGPIGK